MKRQAITQKLRFEVFKRDGFACQYCGRIAPDVILEVDHVLPIALGGTNDVLNLITACWDCNRGKGHRHLRDDTALSAQCRQLADLSARRTQLAMMFEWQRGLAELDASCLGELIAFWQGLVPLPAMAARHKHELRALARRFEAEEIVAAMRIAAESYIVVNNQGAATRTSLANAWRKLGGICVLRRRQQARPYQRDLFYIRGILRNRFSDTHEVAALRLLERCHALRVNVEELRQLALSAASWSAWCERMEENIGKSARN